MLPRRYIKENYLTKFPPLLQEGILKLSLLREIPVELARECTGIADIDKILLDMSVDNFSTRSHPEKNTLFSFHPLFKEILLEKARDKFNEVEIAAILKLAADYYFKRGNMEQALDYYLSIPAYDIAESIIQKEGLSLLSSKNFLTLLARADNDFSPDSNLYDDGTSVHTLRINMLGKLTLRIGKGKVLEAEDLKNQQRQFFALMAASPGHRMSKEKMMLAFWPESSASAASSNIDAFLSRLRKKLAESFPEFDIRYYLEVDKKTIYLKNCTFDTREFVDNLNKAKVLLKNNKKWQAEYYLFKANSLWGDSFFVEEVTEIENVQVYKHKLDEFKVELCQIWAQILISRGNISDAISLLKEALTKSEENDTVIKDLYALYLRQKSFAEAEMILRKYARILRKLDFPEDEISEIIETIRKS